MKDDNFLDVFDSKQKAIDHCIWLNFTYRIAKIRFGVIDSPDNDWAVVEESTANKMEISFLDELPKDHSAMSYVQIRHIRMDREPLPYWESVIGLFSTADGELLRYLLHAKIPVEKFIRFELASRGYDENHRWCGFDRAEDIWLK